MPDQYIMDVVQKYIYLYIPRAKVFFIIYSVIIIGQFPWIRSLQQKVQEIISLYCFLCTDIFVLRKYGSLIDLCYRIKLLITSREKGMDQSSDREDPETLSPLPTKNGMLMISSYNKRLNEQKRKHYQTIDCALNGMLFPDCDPTILDKSAIQQQMTLTNFVTKKGVATGPASMYHSPNGKKKSQQTDHSLNKFQQNYSERAKAISRYPEGFREIWARKANSKGIKVLAKYKLPITNQKMPMKKYIKIQKINLPKPKNNPNREIFIADPTSGLSKEAIKKTIQQYDTYLQRNKQSIEKATHRIYHSNKTHKRNHSSAKHNHSSAKQKQRSTCKKASTASVNLINANKKIIQNFQIRKPMMRKDYFVFGMTERTNLDNKVQYFRDFLWKVNYSNGIYVNTPEQINNNYKAYIGPGNNYHLIKGVLKRRFWWTIADQPNNLQGWKDLNFVWTQLKQNNFYKMQKNCQYAKQRIHQLKTEGDKEKEKYLSSSSQTTTEAIDPAECIQIEEPPPLTLQRFLRRNPSSSQSCSKNDQNGHKKIFSKRDLAMWQDHALKNIKSEQKINEHTYSRRLPLFLTKRIQHVENSEFLKLHNHLQNNFYIGNKKALFYNMRRYLSLKNIDPFSMIPLTFHISQGVDDPEYKIFKKYYEEIEKQKSQTGTKNMWIVKPGENTNRGNGISVAYTLDDVIVRVKGRERNSDGKLRTFILQKYIERPFLYNRRKFDIRHYMLVSCVNGCMKGYWYEEGYIRTSSYEFTIKNCKDPLVHLTNDAIQKNCQNYGKFEKGNKLSYQEFQKYLDSTVNLSIKNGQNRINFFETIIPQMKQIAAQSLKSCYSLLDPNRKQNNFQLLGLDFMLDENLKPWLIEVNTNPCLELSCSLLDKIIPQLVDNVFKICIDPLFPPPEAWQAGRKFFFGDNPLQQNKFQIIFDEEDDGPELHRLFQGSQGLLDGKMGKIQQDNQTFEDNGDENWQANKKYY